MAATPIRLLLADVDGTLVTQGKVLTDRAIDAVHALRHAGIEFAITSGRPPRGMTMLTGPLGLTTPIAAFNGGLIVNADMSVIEQRQVPQELVLPIIDQMREEGLTPWLYRGAEWYVEDLGAPHVAKEANTVQFRPTCVEDFNELTDNVAKLVGVSDNADAMAHAEEQARSAFGSHVSAALSQPYYLDVTNPDANKGMVVRSLAERYSITEEQIATIGDMPNDVMMFTRSGLSIAMGNASPEVQRAAKHVTDSNEDEGFAKAVEKYILDRP